eukprot:scaffold4501_cov108-Isochrysis_galbana.AAC.3
MAAGSVEGHAALARPDARSGRPVLGAELPRIWHEALRSSGKSRPGRRVFEAAKLVLGRCELDDSRLLRRDGDANLERKVGRGEVERVTGEWGTGGWGGQGRARRTGMGHLQREARNRRWALTGGRVRCATACTDCTCLLLRHGPRRSWKQAQSVCARRFVDWRLTQLDLMSDESLGSERKPGSRKVEDVVGRAVEREHHAEGTAYLAVLHLLPDVVAVAPGGRGRRHGEETSAGVELFRCGKASVSGDTTTATAPAEPPSHTRAHLPSAATPPHPTPPRSHHPRQHQRPVQRHRQPKRIPQCPPQVRLLLVEPVRRLLCRHVRRQHVYRQRGPLGRHRQVPPILKVGGRVDPPHARLPHPLPLAVREFRRVAVLVRHVQRKGRRVVGAVLLSPSVQSLDEEGVAVCKVAQRQACDLEPVVPSIVDGAGLLSALCVWRGLPLSRPKALSHQ